MITFNTMTRFVWFYLVYLFTVWSFLQNSRCFKEKWLRLSKVCWFRTVVQSNSWQLSQASPEPSKNVSAKYQTYVWCTIQPYHYYHCFLPCIIIIQHRGFGFLWFSTYKTFCFWYLKICSINKICDTKITVITKGSPVFSIKHILGQLFPVSQFTLFNHYFYDLLLWCGLKHKLSVTQGVSMNFGLFIYVPDMYHIHVPLGFTDLIYGIQSNIYLKNTFFS